MEATEAADAIREAAAHERTEHEAVERFRTMAAIAIAVLAMVLAIASLGGEDATKEMLSSNIRASDTWAFYQAKNIRQTANQLTADELEASILLHSGALSEEARQDVQRRIERYRATVARYENEPDPNDPTNPLKGEGKQQLLAQAQNWEGRREHAELKDRNFDYSRALLQIAIVLGSVAIVAGSRPMLGLGLLVGLVGALLMVNGFMLLVPLPGGEAAH
jgi:hypothetical protein